MTVQSTLDSKNVFISVIGEKKHHACDKIRGCLFFEFELV